MRLYMFLLMLVFAVPARLQAAGFERVSPAAPSSLEIGIWYPSAALVPDAVNTPFRQSLAIDGEVTGEDLPLVLLSHGNGGWMGGHADTALALAEAGYIAVAPTHSGDNARDRSSSPSQWLVTRPLEAGQTIDFMLSEWAYADRIDHHRIGVFGFSAGGYTALVAAGAVPDFSLAQQHCEKTADEYVCRIGLLEGIDPETLEHKLRSNAGDDRVAAVSVAAPGLGFSFGPNGLAGVKIPVQIWSGARDESVPHHTNGGLIAANLSKPPEVHVVEGAGHFAFLSECDPLLKEKLKPRLWDRYCVDASGFDRAAFHRAFNRKLVEFFDAALAR